MRLRVKSLWQMAPQAPRYAVQKKQNNSRRETPKSPRFAEKKFSATLGGFGEVRRINFFVFGCSAEWNPRWGWLEDRVGKRQRS
jgi:hypothetical protein